MNDQTPSASASEREAEDAQKRRALKQAAMEPIIKGLVAGGGAGLGAIVVLGGFVLVSSVASPTLGGTRSYQLRWEKRQAEIDADITAESRAASSESKVSAGQSS